MKQYELWRVILPAPAGRRPVLLLSRNSAYGVLHKFIVAEVTTRIRAIPQEVLLGPREGMPVRCVANFDNVRTVHRSCFVERVGKLAARRVPELKQALGHALAWPELALED